MSELITRNGGTMSSVNFMRLIKSTLTDGIVDGCTISKSGATITVGVGHIIAGGAYVEISNTSVNVTASGELILRVTTSSDTPAQIIARASQTLTQQDLTNGGTTYELKLATYTYASSAVSSLTQNVGKSSSGQSSHEIYVQSAQPTAPNTGDLWFW